MPHDPIDLARIQRWLQAVITHPDGVGAGVDSTAARAEIDVTASEAERLIGRSQLLTSLERLHIYGNAYYARLFECLSDEFPATARAVGRETFHGFALGYLQAYPSTSYTLARLGAKFPQYLRETRPPRESAGEAPDWADFLIDLASFERTCNEVFDGPGFEGRELLTAGDLAGVPPDRFADVRLIPVPCLRLLELRFPVHEFATSVRRDQQPDVPAPRPTCLVVTRRSFIVRRQAVSPVQFAMLARLSAGGSLGDAIEAALAVENVDLGTLAGQLRQWFAEWAASGWFERLELRPAAS
jgi:hypothetical protein